MAASEARMSWGHAEDKDLLAVMTEVLSPSQEQIRRMVDRMRELGYTPTVKAVTY
jgi:hypothetical protein